jgi:cysteine desulfurase/selenocysteine lyase
MLINEDTFDKPSGEDFLNPTLIAQIASRIYNELPGVSEIPKNENEAVISPSELENPGDLIQNNSSFDAVLPIDLTNVRNILSLDGGNIDYNILIPEGETKKAKESNFGWKSPLPDFEDYYFLHDKNTTSVVPLSEHTDNLVNQQTLPENTESAPSLHKFVQKVQSVSGSFSEKTNVNRIFDINQIRKDFPVLNQYVHGKPLIWFDNAATTQKPQIVIDTIAHFYSHNNSNIHRGAHTLAARATDGYEGSRECVRRFLGAGSSSEIIFVRGTTEAINLVSQTWGRKNILPGDEILVSVLEHHANIVPWQMLAKEKGAILKPIPVNDRGEILLDEYSRMLNPRTKLVAVTQASNSIGTILPVKEMIRLAKQYDIKVLVDGAQSVAHLPVNVQDLDADFFVFSGHKIFAPTGIGVLYGKKEILENMPPWQGGGNMIKDVTFEETIYNTIPNKFEAGTPSVGDAIGLGAALDYVNKIGINNIRQYEQKLTVYAAGQLSQIPGVRLIGTPREKVGVFSLIINNINNEQAGRYLDQEGIAVRAGHHCAQPALRRFGAETTVRPSLAFYNTFEEVDRLIKAIKKMQYQ